MKFIIKDIEEGTFNSGNPITGDKLFRLDKDPIINVSDSITEQDITNWDTAHGWGNHAGLYAPFSHSHSWSQITGKPTTFTPSAHTHTKSEITDFAHSHSWTEITGKPTTFTPSTHNHDDRYYTETESDARFEPVFIKNNAFNKSFGTAAGTVAQGNDSRFAQGVAAFNWGNHSGLYSLINHSHSWTEITSKPTTFAPSAHSHSWTEITSKPTTFNPIAHTHLWADITDKPTTFAPSEHTHSGLTAGTGLNGGTYNGGSSKTFTFDTVWGDARYLTSLPTHSHSWSQITSKPTTFTPSAHTHATTDITSGVFDYARLPFSSSNVSNWNTAYGWGNHATQGYLKTINQDNRVRVIYVDPAELPSGYTTADVAAHLNTTGFTISETEIIVVRLASGLEQETDVYIARVEADGGTVINVNYVDAAYKLLKSEGHINSNYSWMSASFGVKKDINNKVSKLYSLKGAAFDLITVGTGASSITWSATGQDNAPEILVDKVVSAAMKPVTPITVAQPNTIFSVVSINYQSSNQYLYDGFSSTGRHILLRNGSGEWTFGTNSYENIVQSIGTSTHIIQANYADDNGRLYVDNVAIGTGVDTGSAPFEYVTLFNYHGNDKQYNMGGKFKEFLFIDTGTTINGAAFNQFFNDKYNIY